MRVVLISSGRPPVIEGGLHRQGRRLSESLAGHGVAGLVLTRGAARRPVEPVPAVGAITPGR